MRPIDQIGLSLRYPVFFRIILPNIAYRNMQFYFKLVGAISHLTPKFYQYEIDSSKVIPLLSLLKIVLYFKPFSLQY